MKIFSALLSAFFAAITVASAVDRPHGSVVEVHALEVYTGGCTASAQSTMGGRSMLRLWSFEKGSQNDVDLRGLQVAALQVADKNLAFAETQPTSAVVYLPRKATDAQRAALVRWLVGANPEMTSGPIVQKVADIEYAQKETRISFNVGEQIVVKTRGIQKCDAGACAESLWYKPRSQTGDYTVLVNESSAVNEPALSLVWKDNSAKSVFFGRFGAESKPEFRLASAE